MDSVAAIVRSTASLTREQGRLERLNSVSGLQRWRTALVEAAVQGGYLLAEAAHDVKPMQIALDMALDQVRACLVT